MAQTRGRPSGGQNIISMLSGRYKEADSAPVFGQAKGGAGRGGGMVSQQQSTQQTTYSFSQEEEIKQDGRTVYKTKEEKSFSEGPHHWQGDSAVTAPAPKVSIKTITLSTQPKAETQPTQQMSNFGGIQTDGFTSIRGQPQRQEDYHYQQTVSTKTTTTRQYGALPQQQQPQHTIVQQQTTYTQQQPQQTVVQLRQGGFVQQQPQQQPPQPQPQQRQPQQPTSYVITQQTNFAQQQQQQQQKQQQPGFAQQPQPPSPAQKPPSFVQLQQASFSQQQKQQPLQQQPGYAPQPQQQQKPQQPGYAPQPQQQQKPQQPGYAPQPQPQQKPQQFGYAPQPQQQQKPQQPGYAPQPQPKPAQPQPPSPQKAPSFVQMQQASFAQQKQQQQQQQPSFAQQPQPTVPAQQQQAKPPSFGQQPQPPSPAQKPKQPSFIQMQQASFAAPQQPIKELGYTPKPQPKHQGFGQQYGQPQPQQQQQQQPQVVYAQQKPTPQQPSPPQPQQPQQQQPSYQAQKQQQIYQQQKITYQQQQQQQQRSGYPQQQPQQPQQQQQIIFQQQQQQQQRAGYPQQQQPQQQPPPPQPQPKQELTVEQKLAAVRLAGAVRGAPARGGQPTHTTIRTTATTSNGLYPWEDEPEEGVHENQPEERPDLIRETDRVNIEAELPSIGQARSTKHKFLTGQLDYRPEGVKREMTPPGAVSGGVFENEPLYNPYVVHGEELPDDPLPESGTARSMAYKFKEMGKPKVISGPTPDQREITPDRTTQGEYVTEPRGFVEKYEGRPESGVFENQPIYYEDVIKADEYEDDRLPNMGLARGMAAHFREMGRYRPPPPAMGPKEFTPPREEGTGLQGYGVYENDPDYDPRVVHHEDRQQDIFPERGMARTIVTVFRSFSSGDNTPKSPRVKKEFTPPRDGGGVYENYPTEFIPDYNQRPESGILENQPEVRFDVVKADMPPPHEVELPERGTARNLVYSWRQKESGSGYYTPTGSGQMKEFTPPREEPRVLEARARRSVSYPGFGWSDGSVDMYDLPGQYHPQAEASVFESEPVLLEDVTREADTDWMEGMPRSDTTRKMVAKFRHIQQQASTATATSPVDYASPAARPPIAGRQEGEDRNSRETSPDKVGRSKSMRVPVQLEKCGACQKTVYAMEKIEIEKNAYHKSCFRCSHCHCILTPKTFAINKNVMFCTNHYKQLFATKGNYDEGFGHDQHKNRWKSDTPPSSTIPPRSSSPLSSSSTEVPTQQ